MHIPPGKNELLSGGGASGIDVDAMARVGRCIAHHDTESCHLEMRFTRAIRDKPDSWMAFELLYWTVEHEKDRSVPREMLDVIRLMEGRLGWTETELIKQAGLGGTRAASMGRKLNERSKSLLETGVRYSTQRTATSRTIFLERVADGQIDDGNDSSDGTFL